MCLLLANTSVSIVNRQHKSTNILSTGTSKSILHAWLESHAAMLTCHGWQVRCVNLGFFDGIQARYVIIVTTFILYLCHRTFDGHF